MIIRQATYHDAPIIKLLLEQLGFNTRLSILIYQLETIYGKNDNYVFVYELRKEVVGFVTVNFIPEFGVDGTIARIEYLVADESVQGKNVEKTLEEYVIIMAKMRKCRAIEISVVNKRIFDSTFYSQEGYQEQNVFYKDLLK